MPSQSPNYLVLPSAGSAGLAWEAASQRLGGAVHPLPDAASVEEMALVLVPVIEAMPRPRVIVGSSLGAMVAVELARALEVDGLVLFAAGYGVEVADSALSWVEAHPDDLFAKMARIGLSRGAGEDLFAVRLDDFVKRGQPVVLNHLRALQAYQPEWQGRSVPTIVVWGENDRSIPLADHVELAMKLGGVVVPLAGVGHAAFLEDPSLCVGAIRLIERLL